MLYHSLCPLLAPIPTSETGSFYIVRTLSYHLEMLGSKLLHQYGGSQVLWNCWNGAGRISISSYHYGGLYGSDIIYFGVQLVSTHPRESGFLCQLTGLGHSDFVNILFSPLYLMHLSTSHASCLSLRLCFWTQMSVPSYTAFH